LEATVWIGYPRGEIPMLHVHGIAVSGPTFPATIWKSFMVAAVGKKQPVEFKEPSVMPTWHSFTRGQYSVGTYSYSPPPTYYSGGGSSGSPAPLRRRSRCWAADAWRCWTLHRFRLAARFAARPAARRAARGRSEVGVALSRR